MPGRAGFFHVVVVDDFGDHSNVTGGRVRFDEAKKRRHFRLTPYCMYKREVLFEMKVFNSSTTILPLLSPFCVSAR